MPNSIVQVHVRVRKGHVTLIGTGKTSRDQAYIAQVKPLTVAKIEDKDFKKELAAAVKELLP